MPVPRYIVLRSLSRVHNQQSRQCRHTHTLRLHNADAAPLRFKEMLKQDTTFNPERNK